MRSIFALLGLVGLLFSLPATAAQTETSLGMTPAPQQGIQLAATSFPSSRVSNYGGNTIGSARDMPASMGNRSGNVVAKIYLSRQEMEVYVNGNLRHTWKISSGRAGYSTPRGTYRPQRIYSSYFSKKYDNAPMPSAVFFSGGFAVHGTGHISALGRRASHGCVRLHPGNAREFFNLAKTYGRNVKIQIL
jgi:hypothetical protein